MTFKNARFLLINLGYSYFMIARSRRGHLRLARSAGLLHVETASVTCRRPSSPFWARRLGRIADRPHVTNRAARLARLRMHRVPPGLRAMPGARPTADTGSYDRRRIACSLREPSSSLPPPGGWRICVRGSLRAAFPVSSAFGSASPFLSLLPSPPCHLGMRGLGASEIPAE